MKTVFLLGGLGGIGGAIKEEFTKAGYKVVAPTSKQLDLSNPKKVEIYLKKHKMDFDALVYCAGRNNPALIENQPFEEVLKTMQVNFLSFFQIAKATAPYFKKKKDGHILAISSVYSVISREGRSAYSASKDALNGFVRAIALELGPCNVKVNALSPGFVLTEMTRKNNTPAKIKALRKKIALGRLANPDDIARCAYFLCSEKNTYISGQNIIIDGGFMAGSVQN